MPIMMLAYNCIIELSYLTLFQALLHASVAMERKLLVEWVCSCDLEDSAAKEVGLADYGLTTILFSSMNLPLMD
jgi:CTP synthase (UTP-ammonia lyase)